MSLTHTQSKNAANRSSSHPPTNAPSSAGGKSGGNAHERGRSTPARRPAPSTPESDLPTFALVDHQFNVPAVPSLLPNCDGVAICSNRDDLLRQVERFHGSASNIAVVTPCEYTDVSVPSEPMPLMFQKTVGSNTSKFTASVVLYTLS
eukprot:443067-Amphidinium_carterae.1